jgi:hypothetical protein
MENNNARLLGSGIQKGKKRTLVKQLDFTEFDPEYVGTFKFHHPSVLERMQIGVIKSQMLQGLEGRVDIVTDNIAHMTATLQVVMDDAPVWFQVSEIEDYEILDTVYEEYIQWYNSFRRANKQDNDAQDSNGVQQ